MKHLSLTEVVEHEYCVGCGLCASQSRKGHMIETEIGTYIPSLSDFSESEKQTAEKYCPFSKESDGEDRLAQTSLDTAELGYLDGLGYFDKTYAGYAIEGSFREEGSSAGLVNWLCAKLLEKGDVEAVIHVKEEKTASGVMYSYQESSARDELQQGAKSKYYPIHLADLLKAVEKSEKKSFAVVGLPCFIKGLRALARENNVLKEKLKFHIGIVCGHLKSKHYAEFLAWQAGVKPDDLKLLDFRTKLMDRPASKYGFTAVPKEGDKDSWIIKPMSDVVGANWGHGLFKLKSCEYCDDVMAETADIVFGDAWLPEFVQDSQGTNIINSRSKFLTELLEEETQKGNIKLINLSPDRVLDSQRSGLRHRREGGSYRSANDKGNFRPFPIKRTKPSSHDLTLHRKQTYEYRELIRTTSHKSFLLAKQHNDLNIALSTLKPVIASYAQLTKASLRIRIIGKAKRLIKKILP